MQAWKKDESTYVRMHMLASTAKTENTYESVCIRRKREKCLRSYLHMKICASICGFYGNKIKNTLLFVCVMC